MSRPLAALGAVVVALAVTLGIGEATRPTLSGPRPAAASAVAPVLGAVRVCPQQPMPSSSIISRLVLGAPAPDPSAGLPSDGAVSVGPLGTPGSGPSVLGRAGQVLASAPVPAVKDGIVIRAQGAPAAGLEVEALTRGDSGLDRGLSQLRCSEPVTDRWFVGASTLVGLTSTLEVANPGDMAVTADIEFAGQKGALDAVRARKLTIAARGRLVLPLDTVVPDEDLLAVHVAANDGRLVSAIRQVRGAPDAPLGVDWIAPSAAPERVAVLPGLPPGPGDRLVVVGNTGADDTVVSVQLTSADAQFVPTGLGAVPVPAHSTRLVQLSALLAGGPASVRLTSESAPIVASAFLDASSADRTIHEFGWAGSGPPLTGAALLADAESNDATTSTLYLSAPDGAATVTLTPVPTTSQPGPAGPAVTVTVPAGRLVAVPGADVLKGPGSVALVVRSAPGSGPLYAGYWRFERGARGPLVTYLALVGVPGAVPVPAVRADLSASLPR